MLRKTLLAVVFATFATSTATAQTMCNKRDEFLSTLQKGYSEAPVAMGLVSNGSVLEVLASENGSWTIIVTLPNGTSCVVASGEAWQDTNKVALGPAA
jgi:hypothetical protein